MSNPMTNGRSIESEHRRWLYTPEAHVTKCQHGSNPDLCIACAHAITEGQAMTDIPVDKRAAEDAMRRKFRVLQTTWERARTYLFTALQA